VTTMADTAINLKQGLLKLADSLSDDTLVDVKAWDILSHALSDTKSSTFNLIISYLLTLRGPPKDFIVPAAKDIVINQMPSRSNMDTILDTNLPSTYAKRPLPENLHINIHEMPSRTTEKKAVAIGEHPWLEKVESASSDGPRKKVRVEDHPWLKNCPSFASDTFPFKQNFRVVDHSTHVPPVQQVGLLTNFELRVPVTFAARDTNGLFQGFVADAAVDTGSDCCAGNLTDLIDFIERHNIDKTDMYWLFNTNDPGVVDRLYVDGLINFPQAHRLGRGTIAGVDHLTGWVVGLQGAINNTVTIVVGGNVTHWNGYGPGVVFVNSNMLNIQDNDFYGLDRIRAHYNEPRTLF